MSLPYAPLRGVRILDLSRILAGPYCSMTLADLGAEVIKVERPLVGDDTRRWGPPFLDAAAVHGGSGKPTIGNATPETASIKPSKARGSAERESVYFLSVNRNKKSICLDLKNQTARKLVVERMVPNCDVVIENFLPGVMEEMGLGYDALRRQKPGLIYASISGYGTTGPYGKRGGYDVVASGIAGLTHITGPTDGEVIHVASV